MASFLDNLDPDDVKARRNNLKLMAGESPMILSCDNAMVNMAVLKELMQSEQWEMAVQRERQMSPPDPMTGQPVESKLYSSCQSLLTYFTNMAQGVNPATAAGGAAPPGPGGSAPPPSSGLPMAGAPSQASVGTPPPQEAPLPPPPPVA